MPSLLELQREFRDGVLHSASDALLKQIRPGRFAPERHLQVYRNNVYESLTSALKAVFPVTERLVGEGFFRYAAASYIPKHRPESGNLHDYGASFAAFLAEFPPARELSYLPDVARLEWAMHESFHAADAEPASFTELAALPPERHEQLKFQLAPSARLLSSAYPILHIWEVNQPDTAAEPSVDLNEGGVQLLVIRRPEVVAEALSLGEYALLDRFHRGNTFGEAAAAALAAQPELDLTVTLSRHLSRGTLVPSAPD